MEHQGDTTRRQLVRADKDEEDNPTYEGKTLSTWLDQLRTGDVAARVQATEMLTGFFPKNGSTLEPGKVASALGDALLKDKSPKVRHTIIVALRRLGSSSVPALILHAAKNRHYRE